MIRGVRDYLSSFDIDEMLQQQSWAKYDKKYPNDLLGAIDSGVDAAGELYNYVYPKLFKPNPRVIEDNLNEGQQTQNFAIEGPGSVFVQVPQPVEQSRGSIVPQVDPNRFAKNTPPGIFETLFGSSTKHNEL